MMCILYKKIVPFIVVTFALAALALLFYRLLINFHFMLIKHQFVHLIHNEIPHAIIIFAVTINSFYWAKRFGAGNQFAWTLAILVPILIALLIELTQGWHQTEAIKDLIRGSYGYIPGLLFNLLQKF